MATRAGRLSVLINNIEGVELDCAFEERVSNKVKHTTSPREVDTATTDHAILEPVQVTVRAGISNYNINAGVFDPARISDAYDSLVSIQREMNLVTLDTGISTHQNMLLTTFDRVRTNRTGQVLDFTATFTEVLFVNEESVLLTQVVPSPLSSVTVTPGPDRLMIEDSVNAGSTSLSSSNLDLTTPENQSILNSLLDGI